MPTGMRFARRPSSVPRAPATRARGINHLRSTTPSRWVTVPMRFAPG